MLAWSGKAKVVPKDAWLFLHAQSSFAGQSEGLRNAIGQHIALFAAPPLCMENACWAVEWAAGVLSWTRIALVLENVSQKISPGAKAAWELLWTDIDSPLLQTATVPVLPPNQPPDTDPEKLHLHRFGPIQGAFLGSATALLDLA